MNQQHNYDLEQYTRRNLRIFGLKENKNEKLEDSATSISKGHLHEEIKKKHIDRMHRIGKIRNSCSRSIIIKFVYQQRVLIFQAKKNLKGSGILIKENIIVPRGKRLRSTEEKYGFKTMCPRMVEFA